MPAETAPSVAGHPWRSADPPSGFGIDTPGDWIAVDLSAAGDPERLRRGVDQRIAAEPDLAPLRDEVLAMVERAVAGAAAAEVLFAAVLVTRDSGDQPVAASLLVTADDIPASVAAPGGEDEVANGDGDAPAPDDDTVAVRVPSPAQSTPPRRWLAGPGPSGPHAAAGTGPGTPDAAPDVRGAPAGPGGTLLIQRIDDGVHPTRYEPGIVALPSGGATRTERVLPVPLTTGGELQTLVVQYLLPVPPALERVAILTFTTPSIHHRDALAATFGTIAASFAWA
ncbi:hypothetical protein AB0L40_22265 [Patulibacter sp. NPDC049589]|uniref:hypothetical protein n=1 Tax=Patulibacter sp. NPDC049589 TaxID=3154731 RepID=UPI0034131715